MRLGITYLVKGRSCDLPISFPLVKFRRHDIFPKKPENLVRVHGLREFLARTEYCLSAKVSRDWISRIATPTNLNRVGISYYETSLGSRQQGNLR